MTGRRLVARGGWEAEVPEAWATLDDVEGWLWERLEGLGYATLMAQDEQIGAGGWWQRSGGDPKNRRGFPQPSWRHFMGPFWTPVQTNYVWANEHVMEGGAPNFSRKEPCIGQHSPFEVVAGYSLRLLRAYRKLGRPSFIYIDSSFPSHALQNGVAKIDAALADYIKQAMMLTADDDTVVFAYGDHGMRGGKIHGTFVGRQEANNPFISVILPSKLHKAQPLIKHHLRRNAEKLTTQFDLHASVLDIVAGFPASKKTVAESQSLSKQRAYSFFGPIPDDRNCELSGVPSYYCLCLTEKMINSNDFTAQHKALAADLVGELGRLLKPVSDVCVTPQLHELKSISIMASKSMREGKGGADRYSLTRVGLSLKPGGAEIRVPIWPLTAVMKSYAGKGSAVLVPGSIERLNRYGKTSLCVGARDNAALLTSICFCKHQTV